MKLRSMLLVPAGSERKLEKSIPSHADALILDREDAVAAARRPIARTMAAQFIREHTSKLQSRLFVRVNPLDSGLALTDLAAVAVPGCATVDKALWDRVCQRDVKDDDGPSSCPHHSGWLILSAPPSQRGAWHARPDIASSVLRQSPRYHLAKRTSSPTATVRKPNP